MYIIRKQVYNQILRTKKERNDMMMKNLKKIAKTLLFSAFMTMVISTNGTMLIPDAEMEIETETEIGEDSISVYSEQPKLGNTIAGN